MQVVGVALAVAVLLVIGLAAAWGAPVLAIPIALVILLVAGVVHLATRNRSPRRAADFRERHGVEREAAAEGEGAPTRDVLTTR